MNSYYQPTIAVTLFIGNYFWSNSLNYAFEWEINRHPLSLFKGKYLIPFPGQTKGGTFHLSKITMYVRKTLTDQKCAQNNNSNFNTSSTAIVGYEICLQVRTFWNQIYQSNSFCGFQNTPQYKRKITRSSSTLISNSLFHSFRHLGVCLQFASIRPFPGYNLQNRTIITRCLFLTQKDFPPPPN